MASTTRSAPRRLYLLALLLALGVGLTVAPAARADVWGTTFDSPSYTGGSIDGQAGWQKTGGYDVNIADPASYPNATSFGFGSKALQISSTTTSGSFGDQAFTPSLVDEAGEASSSSGGLAGGIRRSQFDMRFRVGATKPTEQSGSHMTVSPDRGDGGRMSYLRFEDQADGIHVSSTTCPAARSTGAAT